ncbi:MAG: hypothetical protein GXY58_13405 [Planctomycetaceae bacterium]|nr:hypothetical protein [Planctomycetaceae bacterium]
MPPPRNSPPISTWSPGNSICDYHLPDAVPEYLVNNQGWMHFESGLISYSGSTGGCDEYARRPSIP